MSTLPPIHSNQAPRTSNPEGVAVREDVLFTDAKGREKSGPRKEAEKAIERLKDVLPRLLAPGETVLFIAAAVAPVTAFEQLEFEGYAFPLKGVTLVFTDRRLLRFRRKPKGLRDWEWSRGVRAARWGDVADAKVEGWPTRALTLTYRSGKKEVYRIAKIGDGNKVGLLMPALVPPGTGGAGASTGQDMVSLCPQCLRTLTPQVYHCGGCGLKFMNEKTLLWRNFLLPGGGFFYTGWKGLGFAAATADLVFLAAFVYLLLVAAQVVPPPAPGPGEHAMTAVHAAVLAVVCLLLLLLENSVAWVYTRNLVRDFIPES